MFLIHLCGFCADLAALREKSRFTQVAKNAKEERVSKGTPMRNLG
jgi:hypothetical protein